MLILSNLKKPGLLLSHQLGQACCQTPLLLNHQRVMVTGLFFVTFAAVLSSKILLSRFAVALEVESYSFYGLLIVVIIASPGFGSLTYGIPRKVLTV